MKTYFINYRKDGVILGTQEIRASSRENALVKLGQMLSNKNLSFTYEIEIVSVKEYE